VEAEAVKQKIAVLALAVVALAAGCAEGSGNVWSHQGFEQKTYGWKATFPAGQKDLVGPDWRLDNWTPRGDGTYDEKQGPNYVAEVRHDDDGDGVIGQDEVKRTFFYDLRFTNVRNNGVIWVQTTTISAGDAGKDLDVLLENHSSSIAFSGGTVMVLPSATLSDFGLFRTIISDRTEIELGDHPALSASIRRELAADKSAAGPKAIIPTTRVVLTKFDYIDAVSHRPRAEAARWSNGPPPPAWAPQRRTALMFVGYSNDSERFDAGLADFAKFLGRLSLPRALGPRAAPAQSKPAQPTPAETPAPAPKPREPDPNNPTIQI
jgi:hypothetical protein